MRRNGQVEIVFKKRGGKRKGAGRKPKGGVAGVRHRTRPKLLKKHPNHVTFTFVRGLPNLRHPKCMAVLRRCFLAGKERFGFRLLHYSVQRNHIHVVCEADDKRALYRGVLGLSVRIARNLNKELGRTGQVIADRYHSRALRSPTQTRYALRYVLNNERRHQRARGHVPACGRLDPCSSAAAFNGWEGIRCIPSPFLLAQLATPQSFFGLGAWRRGGGLIDIDEIPGPRYATRRKH